MTQNSGTLFVTSTLEVGGSETKVVKIANTLARDGYPVALAYLNPPDDLLDKVNPEVPVTHLHRRGKYSIASLRKLRSLMTDEFRVVISVNFYPLLYITPAVNYLSRRETKTVCLVNTTDFVDGQWIWGHIYSPFLRLCDQLVFGCKYQQDLWINKYRLPAGRSTFIYNGVDCDFFSPEQAAAKGEVFRARFGIPRDAIVVGSVGRFAPEKNFDLLIHAIGNLHALGRHVYLILIGQGREASNLQAAAARFGVSSAMICPGKLEDVRPALSAMDIFVLPSRAVETFSNAALEAMSVARPAILSNIGGAAEMVEHGVNGLLFEAGDVDTLTTLLVNLYESSAERERLGIAARRKVIEQFNFEKMTNSYKLLIDSVDRPHRPKTIR